MASTRFNKRFQVPEAAIPVIDRMVDPQEILLIESLAFETFTPAEARQALEVATGAVWTIDQVDPLLHNAYRRGVIQSVDETQTQFAIGSFYTRLDIFAISEPDSYLALPRQTQIALDQWYFDAYLAKLSSDSSVPSGDQVVPLAEAIAYLDSTNDPIWLNRCDCRTLAGNCALPTAVCISFRKGVNTFSHRGWSKPLTKEQGRAVLEGADQAGLVHTINPGGICNCCSDCCYLFRAQRARQSRRVWPVSRSIAVFHQNYCVGCGRCVDRCPFGAFRPTDQGIRYDPEHCRGCGLCRESCPAGAIDIIQKGT